jgi:hypothetical protein
MNTMNYNEKCKLDTWLKRTQSNPILSASGGFKRHTCSGQAGGLATIKIVRMDYPLQPCILLSNKAGEAVLSEALGLDVFSVIDKPVNMSILREQLNRLFIKKYNNGIFAE